MSASLLGHYHAKDEDQTELAHHNYNRKSGLAPGTALMCLLLTDENCEGNATQFSTFQLSPPPDMDITLHNAVVVRESSL